MQQQPKRRPPNLSWEELVGLGRNLKQSCRRLQAVDIAIRNLSSGETIYNKPTRINGKRLTSPDQISEPLALRPLAAVLLYAFAGDGWRDSMGMQNSNFAKYMRSLVRRMKREARALQASGVLCLSY